MKLITALGTRPQFVKASVVSRALMDAGVIEKIVHTGQHYDYAMSELFFRELGIPEPAYHLGVGGGTHGQNTGRMIEKCEEVFLSEKPDMVMVYGDTDTTLAASLAASKLNIPIAHVEAGLRSFNSRMPEETNRRVTDHVSSLLFAPTQNAADQLRKEGISQEKIRMVGDVMLDAVMYFADLADRTVDLLTKLEFNEKPYALATFHRPENVDDKQRLLNILCGLEDSGLDILLPLHPRTKNRMEAFGLQFPRNVHVLEPLGYLEMLHLEKNAKLVITDSGGVQKEAYFNRIPCVTLRNETEWQELLESNWNILVPPDDKSKISSQINLMVGKTGNAENLYGNGDASEKIAAEIKDFL